MMVQLRVISVASDEHTVVVADDTTVGDTRAVVAGLLGLEVERVKLNLRGALLQDDEATWSDVKPHDGDKLYVAADTSARGRQASNTHGNVGAAYLHLPAPAQGGALGSGALQAPGLPPAMADMFLNNLTPETIDMLMRTVPELRNLEREHPQMAREMRDPEFFRNMMRAQLDPASRRAQQQAQGAQMAQIGAIPGGWQMAERLMHSLQRDDAREGDADLDGSLSDSRVAMPVAGLPCNNEPLPNPWARPQPPPAPPSPAQPFPHMGGHAPPPPSLVPTMPGGGFATTIRVGSGGGRAIQVLPPQPAPSTTATGAALPPASTYAYARQLTMLRDEMGFDEETARLALDQTSGDVDAAVLLLAEWQGQDG